ncbi:acyl-CoA dehydrogenase [Desulfoluna sp.]|uniref:acyl-CoA dehydrogenase n=1 Tax=Desulfoluna sp. TaxID=2045199 RepID=UPI00260F6EE7|nr:acyl-CoA dehydrogenase [Desulfoluna sp.]
MAQLIADKRDIDFVLHEQLNVGTEYKAGSYAEFNRKTIDMIIGEARNLGIKEMLPLQKVGDGGCTFDAGTVTVPEGFKHAYDLYCEGEWLAMSDDPEWGGQGLPHAVSMAANEYFYGSCNAFMLYNMLSHGAAKLIEGYGTEAQKKQVLKKMFSGEWSGTMLLTEPEAGSDVGALTTVAKNNGDGTYSISGSKIFISGGEQNMVSNIIHPVLARLEDAPAGTRGISLFMVPKYRINDDGSLGDFNDVVCTGIEEKMGLHGNCTCSLTLGGKGECIGTLLGEENKGMAAMFLMMNEARQMVGLQGFACATASYIHALNYARERVQTKGMTDPSGSAPVAIINHPDVKRQLLIMKSYVDGMRSLLYFGGLCHDRIAMSEDADERSKYGLLLEVLTPVIKGYITDKAFEVCSHGIQVYGGYGYVEEFPVAQLLRDSRIFMIYEGTNGIQSMDLLGRKLGMKKGKPFMDFLEMIQGTINQAKGVEAVASLAENMQTCFAKYTEVVASISKAAMSDKVLDAYAFSHPLLEVTGDLTMAWMLLWRATVAAPLVDKKKKDSAFYKGQITTARFFINTLLPSAMGKMDAIQTCDGAVTAMDDAGFGGK